MWSGSVKYGLLIADESKIVVFFLGRLILRHCGTHGKVAAGGANDGVCCCEWQVCRGGR